MILYRFVVVYILLIFYDYHIIFHCMWIQFFSGYFRYSVSYNYNIFLFYNT